VPANDLTVYVETDLHPVTRDIGRIAVLILIAAIVVSGTGVAVYMYSVDRYALTYYGDAGSHLVAARKLFDWAENPGWSQMGTVWLPLPHFLLMFPSFIDEFFFSGFAGLVVSLPSLALTSVLLYKMVTRTLKLIPDIQDHTAKIAAFSAALLYGLNPNFLYLGITAMTEAPFMLFFVGSAYFLMRWYEESQGQRPAVRYLVAASVLASAATLCRYEGWILPIFLISVPAVVTVLNSIRKRNGVSADNSESKQMPRRLGGREVLAVILAGALSLSGIAFWLVYNAVTYGDPMEFANAQYYSAASQALSRSTREGLFLQPLNVMSVYGATSLLTYGPVVLVASVIGYIHHRRMADGRKSRRNVYIFLILAPVFTIVTLIIGIGEMAYWFNSRFVVLAAPILVLLVALYIARQPRFIASNRKILLGVIASLFIFQLVTVPLGAVVTLADAKGGFMHKHSPYAVALGERIGSLYDGSGSIMVITGSAQEHRILLASGLAFSHFDSIIESSTWKKSFYEPWNYENEWIILSKDPDSDGVAVVKYWNDNKTELLQYYDLEFEDEFYEVYKLKL
jgi:hypothetical protein